MPEYVDNSGGEDGDGENGVVTSVNTASNEGIGVDFCAGFFDEEAESELDEDGGNENDDSDRCVIGGFGSDDFFDGFDEGSEASIEDNSGND